MTDGGAEKVLACSASSLPGAARAARDDAITATPVKAELPEADRVAGKRMSVGRAAAA